MSCPFCAIASGRASAKVVYQTEDVIAFNDIHPQAEHHILVIPKEHIQDGRGASPVLWSSLMTACQTIAKERGLSEFRLVVNSGEAAGQTVPHLHVHLLGGKMPKLL